MNNSQKVDDRLNLAMNLNERQREFTTDLNVGYDVEANMWDIIVKYNGNIIANEDINALTENIEILTKDYAIVTILQENIDAFATFPQIEFVEKPSRLYFALDTSLSSACIATVQNVYGLQGEGVLLGILDSGIDYSHPDFRNEDGTTRIASLWDQTIPGNPPPGFSEGSIYTSDDINSALEAGDKFDMLEVVPSDDFSGHGTHVAGIAGGNGRASGGRYKGVAPEAEFIIVKLGNTRDPFPSSVDIMRALVFVIREAEALGKPIAINLSFGNNAGPHDGKSLFETFIDTMADEWKNVIVVGTGNEGDTGLHTNGAVEEDEERTIEIAIFTGEKNMTIQLWKSYSDEMTVEIEAPNGTSSGPIKQILGKQQFVLDGTQILLYYGEPSPYNLDQQIYIEMIPTLREFITEGVWKIKLRGINIVSGVFDMWLPSSVGKQTKFLKPTIERTLTMPSTATKAITVGAYNSATSSLAPFSGRGFTRPSNVMTIKPDLVAPGVDITAPVPGGGYDTFSGTSMATPFVTGSAALLMEWGIVQGNDPYLYGEKIKSYLQRAARRNFQLFDYPSMATGYGVLCLANVFDNLSGQAVDTLETYAKMNQSSHYTQYNPSGLEKHHELNETRIDDDSNLEECKTAIISDDYLDLLVEYEELDDIYETYEPTCVQIINPAYAIVHISRNGACLIDADLSHIPQIYGPYARSALDTSGILTFHDQPFVPLLGSGVLIGIVDSGIDYNDDIFKYENNTTKIVGLWDQTIAEGPPPEGFSYGTVYTEEQINEALNAEDPLSVVPSVDTSGHGTFLAGMAAGRQDPNGSFVGAAPDASLVVVKLKQAKQCFRDFYLIDDDVEIYQDTDMMLGLKYITEMADKLHMPVAIIVGLGSNQGAHDGTSIMETYVQSLAQRNGNAIIVAAGNEANLAHHYRGQFTEEEESKNVEIKVAPNESGFTMTIWSNAPDKISLSVTSPTGEVIERIPATLTAKEEVKLLLERTVIFIEYQLSEARTGDEAIFIRMVEPTEGIWTFTLYGDLIINGRFDIWLPREGWIDKETQFLQPDPYTTVTDPSTTIGVITVGAYNHQTGSLYLPSGRGLTRDYAQKPDLVAPGVGVVGPLPNNQFGPMSGTSVSTAITAGAAALLLEWGIVQGNDSVMDTNDVRNYLIRGATRTSARDYPNREWGYGELNLLGSFEAIRGTRQ
ncbi:S8 family peptidase [Vallitalea pronyensis]|uniref:S8 family peptidase n=1 Tax=Vallitalea pronyensis TaxID=1348613 RepID=A0A8J8MN78_9FIRM|nr:S8 family peptidase [Vallitalea pronyensis]QUI24646.1 S8 family peptidase [Vallitalea pronyensis]